VPDERLVERSVSAKGRRRMRGTYTLRDAGAGGTDVTFELVVEEAPLSERVLAPVLRPWLQRTNETAMRRLRAVLAG
jgi:hypothetical protein